ncbi:hypothetical protein JQ633_28995 [Bradyrhizobium tropiciagri]|uniref:hypothetical protein n=1 Tax=Bradyrhizobium tropiciagri TaxID=312253 RepID=UPI001BA77BE8|nr:hypothetical protein [Bradyrhizobium tropiciagri]MBR0874424.1 hypothetical protein [Bradyrhizobium tropiciagri]
MLAKVIFALGTLGVAGGYVAYEASKFDPSVYPYSRQQAQAMLVAAKTAIPRRDNNGQIEIWSTGPSNKGVMLNMRYSSKAPLIKCDVAITEIAPNQVRATPDCGGDPKTESVIARTGEELRVPMFAEHVEATLNNRAFDRARAAQKEVAITFKNLNAMQNEALESYAEAQRMQYELDPKKR